MKATDIFHRISYVAYPLLLVTMYYYVFFLISLLNQAIDWGQLNYVLIFMGLAISFTTLQDTTKTQNKFSRKIWESPRYGKLFLIMLSAATLLIMGSGLFGFIKSANNIHEEISVGLIVLSIGLVGMLKAAIEMFENHRLDKQPNAVIQQ